MQGAGERWMVQGCKLSASLRDAAPHGNETDAGGEQGAGERWMVQGCKLSASLRDAAPHGNETDAGEWWTVRGVMRVTSGCVGA